jgi:hypothetical protein
VRSICVISRSHNRSLTEFRMPRVSRHRRVKRDTGMQRGTSHCAKGLCFLMTAAHIFSAAAVGVLECESTGNGVVFTAIPNSLCADVIQFCLSGNSGSGSGLAPESCLEVPCGRSVDEMRTPARGCLLAHTLHTRMQDAHTVSRFHHNDVAPRSFHHNVIGSHLHYFVVTNARTATAGWTLS